MSDYIKLLLIIGSFIIVSCSSSKSIKSTHYITELPPKSELNLQLKLSMNVNIGNSANRVNSEINIAGYDSLSMLMFTQFNLPIAKLYSTKKYFALYNLFEDIIYEGNPNKISFQELFMLPISIENLIDILICQPYSSSDNFILEKSNEKDGTILFTKKLDKFEFVLYSAVEGGIIQYQQKALDGSIIMNISYANYKDSENIYYPSKIVVTLPNANLEINVVSAKKIVQFDSRFSFSIPKGIERVQITE